MLFHLLRLLMLAVLHKIAVVSFALLLPSASSYLTKPGAFTNQTNKGLNNHKHINLTEKAARCLPLLTQMQVFNCLHLTSLVG